ncbi:MAG: DUF4281 domain-containing protein [Rhodovulum sulfidophilum]|uniref:DUF4281 domain-containing protein n=1 Tax=Rhodovulum sulfidophilum TaxID=35806 RepID=A0A2W5NCW5_RHOSU|nr:MAG: DUF4281 domain-containing protein [Rhodovulum sulfidophilum]
MDFDAGFAAASRAAMAGWLALALLPRWPWLVATLRYWLVGALSLAYAVLVFAYFFRVEGGGFGDMDAARALFQSDPVLLAGWIHYLAFDLFVGIWIARRADAIGLGRAAQAPILLATLMFGPVGLLLFYACQAAPALFAASGREAFHVDAHA